MNRQDFVSGINRRWLIHCYSCNQYKGHCICGSMASYTMGFNTPYDIFDPEINGMRADIVNPLRRNMDYQGIMRRFVVTELVPGDRRIEDEIEEVNEP